MGPGDRRFDSYLSDFGDVTQLVRVPPCRGGGCGFESHRHRGPEGGAKACARVIWPHRSWVGSQVFTLRNGVRVSVGLLWQGRSVETNPAVTRRCDARGGSTPSLVTDVKPVSVGDRHTLAAGQLTSGSDFRRKMLVSKPGFEPGVRGFDPSPPSAFQTDVTVHGWLLTTSTGFDSWVWSGDHRVVRTDGCDPSRLGATPIGHPRGISSSGRAPALQAGGTGFETLILHQLLQAELAQAPV